MNFEEEQREILEKIEEIGEMKRKLGWGGTAWNKFMGDVACRVVRNYLGRHIPEGYKIVGPNAYVESLPIEFDLLVVDGDAEPEKYTNAYPIKSLRIVIEVKKCGIIGSLRNLNRILGRIHKSFSSIVRKNHSVRCVYLAIQEVGKPKRKRSINYLEETRKRLYPFKVFALKESRTGEPIKGEWKKFVEFIKSNL